MSHGLIPQGTEGDGRFADTQAEPEIHSDGPPPDFERNWAPAPE